MNVKHRTVSYVVNGKERKTNVRFIRRYKVDKRDVISRELEDNIARLSVAVRETGFSIDDFKGLMK